MFFVAYALMSLVAANSVADSTKGVRFERRYMADPCETSVLVFTTVAGSGSHFDHRFRLNSTDTIFTAQGGSGSPIWEGLKRMEVTVELFFSRQQSSVLQKTLGSFLGRGAITVKLYYEYNAATKDYLFYFFVNHELASSHRAGKTQYYEPLERLHPDVAKVVRTYGAGINLILLHKHAPRLQNKWRDYCRFVQESGNITEGEYALWYDESTREAKCSIKSSLPWHHLVFFGSSVAATVTRSYDRDRQTHLTLGSRGFPEGQVPVCNITFPDGMVALQSQVLEEVRTTPAAIAPAGTTPYPPGTSPSPTVFDTTLGNRTDSELGEASESSVSGGETAAAVVVVVLALLLLGGFGLFRYRDRLMAKLPEFKKVPTED